MPSKPPPYNTSPDGNAIHDPTKHISQVQQSTPAPYTPSAEQQQHIDDLNGSSNLAAMKSTTQTEYFDVLPSFQMFQSILRRDDSQFNENLRDTPPVYDAGDANDPIQGQPTPGEVTNPDPGVISLDHILNAHEQPDDPSDMPREDEVHPLVAPYVNTNVGMSPLDNIDKLAKATNPALDISINVTKQVPMPHVINERETRLKMYSSGDVVNGYIIISNTSDKPIEFGLFTVSLDGTVKCAEKAESLNSAFLEAARYKKIWIKKFIKMYDLNASYGYTHIPNSAGIKYEEHSVDPSDMCYLGLPDNRVLQPHTKYKKFFTFKFPEQLLDNTCAHRCASHILPPPSFGVDRTCFYGKGESIQINKALGYGYLHVRGTPLATKDYSFDETSVSYTIEAKIIDKANPKDRGDFSEFEVNVPNNGKDYVISRSNQYFLEFVPHMKNNGPIVNNVELDKAIMKEHAQLLTWKLFDYYNKFVEQEIEEKLGSPELTPTESKLKILTISDALQPLLDEKKECKSYDEEPMICTHVPVNVFGRKKKMILSSLVQIGTATMKVRIPDMPIPYMLPKLLMKYNIQDLEMSPADSQGIEPITSMPVPAPTKLFDPFSLRPSITNAGENIFSYNVSSPQHCKSLEVHLLFDSHDLTYKPPQIGLMELNLVCWSFRADYPIPFKIGHDFLYTNEARQDERNNNVADITRQNLQAIKDKAFGYRRFLKESDMYIARDAYLYLQSVKTFLVKKDTVKDYFRTLTSHTHGELLNSESEWKSEHRPGTAQLRWLRTMEVPLETINRHSIHLVPSFQNCVIGRLYCLQVVIKFKGAGGEQNEYADNIIKLDVPVIVGNS